MADDAENVQMVTRYRVSTNAEGEHRWWNHGDAIPEAHTAVRPSTDAEARLMDRIMAHDRRGRMPPLSLGAAVMALMSDTTTAIARATGPTP